MQAFRALGYEPIEQPVPACGGANVLAVQEGSTEGYVVVGAHFDHLGVEHGEIFWGADDNAAAVAILVDVARRTLGDTAGMGLIFAAFDGEEPPFFGTAGMGSLHFVKRCPVPVNDIRFMICMDLLGHRLGPIGLPDEVGSSIFALGAERSEGTLSLVRDLSRAVEGLVVRTIDAEVIPGKSDYQPFWDRNIPFLFLTGGRSRAYHTPEDTPDKLDYPKIDRTADWLLRFLQAVRQRPGSLEFLPEGNAHLETIEELDSLLGYLPPSGLVEAAQSSLSLLKASARSQGRLGPQELAGLIRLVSSVEQGLS